MAPSCWIVLATLCVFSLTNGEGPCDSGRFETLAVKHFAAFCGNVTAIKRLEKCESRFGKIRAAVALCGHQNATAIQEACSSNTSKAVAASWCILRNTPHASTKELRDLVSFHKCLGVSITSRDAQVYSAEMDSFLKKCGPKIRRVRSAEEEDEDYPELTERRRERPPKRRRQRPASRRDRNKPPRNYQQQQSNYQRGGPPVEVYYRPGREYRALFDEEESGARSFFDEPSSSDFEGRGARSLFKEPSPSRSGVRRERAHPPSAETPKPSSRPDSGPKPSSSRPGSGPSPTPKPDIGPPKRALLRSRPRGRAALRNNPPDSASRSVSRSAARARKHIGRLGIRRRESPGARAGRNVDVPKSRGARRARKVDVPKSRGARRARKVNAPKYPAGGRGARKVEVPILSKDRGARKVEVPLLSEDRVARKVAPEAISARQLSPGSNSPVALGSVPI